MKPVKIAALALGALLVLLLVALGVFIALFDPNNYKDELQKAVHEHTGRQLELPGKLSLAVFPRIAIEFGPATLGNAPGFGAEPMLSVDRVRLGLRLMPLLHKRVEVDTAEFTRPALRLAVGAHGQDNWSDLGGKQQPAEGGGDGSTSVQLSIAGVKIIDGSLSYDDRQKDSRMAVSDLKLDTGALGSDHDDYSLAAPVIELTLKGNGLPRAGIQARLGFSALTANFKAQTLRAEGMQIEALGAKLTGSLSGKSIIDAPVFTGPVTLAELSLRELLPKLEIAVPVTSEPSALKRLGFSAQLTATGNSLQLGQLKLQLDESAVTGSAGISNLDTMALAFDLAINHLDADHYLAPAAPAAPAAAAAGKSPPVAVPVDLLRSLNLHGSVAVNEAVFAGVNFTRVRLGVSAAGGKLHLFPSEAQLYGGQYHGDINLDASGATPTAAFNEQVSGVDFAPLMKDWFKTTKASGRGNFAVKGQARGRDSDAMLRALNGTLKVNVDNGAIEGIDLWYEIRRAHALLKKQSIPDRSGPARTLFTSLGMSGGIANGVLTSNDISAATRALRVTGKGTIDLVQSSLDIRLNAAVQKVTDTAADADMNDVVGFVVPVDVTGPLTDPKVRPDLEAIARAAVQQKLDEKKQQLEQQLRDKLQDKLKGLFGN